jgi:hypothetical protein
MEYQKFLKLLFRELGFLHLKERIVGVSFFSSVDQDIWGGKTHFLSPHA